MSTALVTVNQDMKALTPAAVVDGAYLARYLKAKQPEILGWVRATTADNFPFDRLLDLEIELPSLMDQHRIAAILDQADALHAKRRQVLAHLDPSPRRSSATCSISRSFQIVASTKLLLISQVGRVWSLMTTPPSRPIDFSRSVQSREMGSWRTSPSHSPRATSHHRVISFVMEILLFSRANTPDLVGAVGIVDEEPSGLALPDKLWRFVWRDCRRS